MSAQQANDPIEHDKRETLNALIGEQVIHRLGEPHDLRSVQVRPLWQYHYRVNVLTGESAATVKIANSYFVAADRDGNIVESRPNITKEYGPAERKLTAVALEAS